MALVSTAQKTSFRSDVTRITTDENSVTIKRRSGTTKNAYNEVVQDESVIDSSVPCLIQPLGAEDLEVDATGEQRMGTDWGLFRDGTDIKKGDIVEDGSTRYQVAWVEVFSGMHVEAGLLNVDA